MSVRRFESGQQEPFPLDEVTVSGLSRDDLRRGPLVRSAAYWGLDHPDANARGIAEGVRAVWEELAPHLLVRVRSTPDDDSLPSDPLFRDRFWKAVSLPNSRGFFMLDHDSGQLSHAASPAIWRGAPLDIDVLGLPERSEDGHFAGYERQRALLQAVRPQLEPHFRRFPFPNG